MRRFAPRSRSRDPQAWADRISPGMDLRSGATAPRRRQGLSHLEDRRAFKAVPGVARPDRRQRAKNSQGIY
jgi:hypothetical protein